MSKQQFEHITKIRKGCKATPRIQKSLNNSIKNLAQDLYNKDTHFIFELLQNAEDNEYNHPEPFLSFYLTKNDPTSTKNAAGALIVQNNEAGFSREHVDAICAVGETTKEKLQGYIGEKGIGFKSVFRVTSCPYIYSNGYSFCLPEHDMETGLGYIVPKWVEKLPDRIKTDQTNIILPLNQSDFGYEVIAKMFKDIKPETILFLSKLKEIHIGSDTGNTVKFLKDNSNKPRVDILVEGENDRVDEFLLYSRRFEKPVNISHEKRDKISEREVTIAFPLNQDNESAGKIFAYLPVRSDTGWPFVINADFILPSSREDIKDVPWNRWLMECVADLVLDALLDFKKRNHLTVQFLEKLAGKLNEISKDENSLYYPLVGSIKNAFIDHELLPTNDGSFISAKAAKLAGLGELRELLSNGQLRHLLNQQGEVKWLANDITLYKTPKLHEYLIQQLGVQEIALSDFAQKLSESFLTDQSDEWFVAMYSFFSGRPKLWKKGRFSFQDGPLRSKPIIRLQDGSHVKPFDGDESSNAYLTEDSQLETSMPIVKVELSRKEESHKFLKELRIRPFDIIAEVKEQVLPEYTEGKVPVSEHEQHLHKIRKAFEDNNQQDQNRLAKLLKETPFVRIKSSEESGPVYRKPSECYFENDDLLMYFEGNDAVCFVHPEERQSCYELLEQLRVKNCVRINRRPQNEQGYVVINQGWGNHKRGLEGFDPTIQVDGMKFALENPNENRSKYIWDRIAIPNSDCIRGTVESSSRKNYENSQKEVKTSDHFGRLLRSFPWLPNQQGNFKKPSELKLSDLPESFKSDNTLAEQLGMKPDIDAKLARQVGITIESLDVAREYECAGPETKEKIVQVIRSHNHNTKPPFPERKSPNPERREKKIAEQHANSPEKNYEKRERSVRTTSKSVDKDVWLRNQYTNAEEQMVCQICKKEMPFKKRDGYYYFESVEILNRHHFSKEHEAQYVALCPLCAAKFKEFIRNDKTAMLALKDSLIQTDGCKVPLQLGKEQTSIRFVATHIQYIKTILRNEK